MLLVSSLIWLIWHSSSYSCRNSESAWCKSGCSWTAALADEIVALLVQKTLLDDLDLHVKEVSQCTILYHLVRYASSSVLHTKFLQLSMSYWAILQFPKIFAVADLSCHCCEWRNFSLELLKALLKVSCLKLSILAWYPVKLDNFLVVSSYHGTELQKTHQLLTGCQWSWVCWNSHLLTSTLLGYPSCYYLHM